MALNRSPEFKVTIVQIVCAIEIQFECISINQEPLALPKGALHQLSCSIVADCSRKLLSLFHFQFYPSYQISSI